MKMKVLILTVCFFSLLSYSTKANAANTCLTISVDCGEGEGSYALACGNNTKELVAAAGEMGDVICGTN